MSRNWLRCLFARRFGSSRRRPKPHRLAFEPLERRDLLTTFAVDIADPDCGDAGDKLFCEIQEAVDVASSKDKIKVHAGTYQPFVIDKDNLTIREAKGNSDPIIDATGVENGVEVNANGVTLKGLEVQNAGNIGFLVSGDNNTLRGNTASDNGPVVSSFAHGYGFFVSGDNNTLIDNTASDNSATGFLLLGSDNNTLRGNTASGNSSGGFLLQSGSSSNTLRGNTASDNSGGGFLLGGSDNNTLRGNTASGNGGDGFLLYFGSNNNTLIDNKAIDNAGWGFFIEELLANMFDDNECKGNVLGGSNLPNIC